LKLGDFGPFVIFAAIYAGGTLGLPHISFLAYQLKIGEMASAFVAIFGIPAVLGLTLGQFIANLGVEAKPLAMISPIISFVGLLAIYYLRKLSTLAGCLVYIAITGIWLSLTLPILNPETSGSLAALGVCWTIHRRNCGVFWLSLGPENGEQPNSSITAAGSRNSI
jgi:hypothetical protein